MWKVKHIQASNFMSFDKVAYSFEDKCYVIRGENNDNDGQKSNGSGKTSFADIIAVALLGYSLTGRNTKDCVKWDSDSSSFTVQVELHNEPHKLTCVISRTFYSNTKSAELTILVNGEVPKTIPTKKGVKNGVDTRAGDAYILKEILDIKAEDLLNYYLISGKYYQPFLRVNTDRKLEVISRFSKSEVVDKAIAKLEVEQETNRDSIVEYESLINQCDGYIAALQDSLNEDRQAIFETLKAQRIDELVKKKDTVGFQTFDLDEDVKKIEKKIEEKRNQKVKIGADKKSKLQVEHDQLNVSEELALVQELNFEIQNIKNYLNGLITCPNCDHKFSVTSEEQYTEDDLSAFQNELINVEQIITNNQLKQSKIREQIQKIEGEERNNKLIENEIESLNRNIKSIQSSQQRLLDEYDKIELEIANESAKTFEDERADVGEQIREKERSKLVLQNQLEVKRKEDAEIANWINNFNDFKFYLGNKPLEIICGLVNQYLKFNGSDLNLHIEGFKKLKNGEIRQALTPVIYRNWTNPKDYNSFSAGEQCRLNLATDLAFQQLINMSSKYGGLELYLSDELTNPLDSLGIQSAAYAFNQLGKTIILVSHAGADMNYDNTVVIRKQNTVSEVI